MRRGISWGCGEDVLLRTMGGGIGILGSQNHFYRSFRYQNSSRGLDLAARVGVRMYLNERVFVAPRLRLVGSYLSMERGVSVGVVLRL